MKKFGLRWGPALAMMVIIYWASDTPRTDLPGFGGWDTLVKKGGHALGYALLALATLHGLADGRRPTPRQAALAALLAGLYAVTDEAHQAFVAGRHPSVVDAMIDMAGAIAGAALRVARGSATRSASKDAFG